jgi:CMP-N-acetylneuraminic acid synthetase
MKFIIPAREGSKGLPGKNRILLDYTIDQIPAQHKSDVIVTTDDQHVINKLKNTRCEILKRSIELSGDKASIRDVLKDVIENYNIPDDETIVMLYLTYPQRSWQEIVDAIEFFYKSDAKSLLCQKEVKTHPYLCLYKVEENRGKQIVKHDMYRRQDYPVCFELSHYVCIFKASEIKLLNKNMYNDFTVFFPIDDRIDIDASQDLRAFHDQNNC